jgi:pyruvate dehydrogenase E2 component (dihydrolipoamide acetyltransferase)
LLEPIEVRLPVTEEGIVESLVVFWHYAVGDWVDKGQTLLEVQTEKAAFEIECPVSGKLRQILIPRGGVAKVGDVIALMEQRGEGSDCSEQRQSVNQTGFNLQETAQATGEQARSVQVSPRLRRLAKELEVALARIVGTGPEGKITENDIQTAAKQDKEFSTGGETVEITPVRRMIANRMMQSLQQSAQLTLTAWADVTAISLQRKHIAPEVSWNSWVLRAAALALLQHPHMNSVWTETGIRHFTDIHLGVAVDTEAGLLVPVLRQSQHMSLVELNTLVSQRVKKARDGKLPNDELSGSTFTVTNLGSLGIEFFTPILNHPETAILGVGQIEKKLVMENKKIVEQTRIPLSLTFDHRIIDGAPAARFLQTLTQLLGSPEQLL